MLPNNLPYPVSYIPRRLHRESPKLLNRSYSPVSLSSSLVDSSLETPSLVKTARPLMHISYENWIYRHMSHTSQVKSECRICAHILWELNKHADHAKLVHISQGNWICRHNRRGRDRDRDQGHPEVRALPEEVEIVIEKTSFIQRCKPPEEVWGKSPRWTLQRAPCLFQ